MAKIFGIAGDVSGKIANQVYAVVKGVNIVRKYNPQPANPQTQLQVESRAKLKLLSQLSAAIKKAIAMQAKGLQSVRNVFTKVNYGFTLFDGENADINLADIQFTASSVGMVGFRAERVAGYGISVELLESVFGLYDQVVWIVCKKLSDGRILVNESKVMDITQALPMAATIMQDPLVDASIHCYGIRFNTELGKAEFSNIVVPSAEEVARIVTSRKLNSKDYTLTETRGVYLGSEDTEVVTSGAAVKLVLGFTNDSSVKDAELVGAGSYSFGDTVNISAPEVEGSTFQIWYDVDARQTVASTRETTITMGTRNRQILAYYEANQ